MRRIVGQIKVRVKTKHWSGNCWKSEVIYADNGEAGSVTRGEACYGAVGGVTEE